MIDEVDIVVVGSGAAGMIAALRAHDAGMKVVIVEKARQYGGSTATSGGLFWVPDHGLNGFVDSPAAALGYPAIAPRSARRTFGMIAADPGTGNGPVHDTVTVIDTIH